MMRILPRISIVVAFALATGVASAQIRAVTDDGKVVILNSDGTWKYAPPPGKASAPGKQPGTPKAAEREMTPAEIAAGWKGEKVILLEDRQQQVISGSGWLIYKPGQQGKPLPGAVYGGKLGTITAAEIKFENYGPRPSVVIRIDDTGEEIISAGSGYGYLEELKIAEGVVGKRLWTKGRKGSLGLLPPGTALTVTKAGWGNHGIELEVRAPDGRGGAIPYYNVYAMCAGSRFHLHTCDPGSKQTSSFFLEDPRKLFPAWTASTWRLIESFTFDAGMTMDMLEAVCGDDLQKIGGQWIEEKKTLAEVFFCQGKRIMVSNNRIIEWKRE